VTKSIFFRLESAYIMPRPDLQSGAVLVGGGTGTQGGAVARELLDASTVDVHVLTRSPNSTPARVLAERGATVVTGDYADPASLHRAFADVDRAFFVTDYLATHDPDVEREQGYNVVDAAESQDLDHLVFSSTVDVETPHIPHFASKYAIEERLQSVSVSGTVLRPGVFYQNFEDFETAVRAGFLPFPVDSNASIPMVDVRDLGTAAAHVLADPDAHAGEAYTVAAFCYSLVELAKTITRVTDIKTTPISIPLAVIKRMDDSLGAMFEWFNDAGKSRGPPSPRLPIEFAVFDTYLRESDLLEGSPVPRAFARVTAPVRPPFFTGSS